jgi:hypothetical protein
MDTIQSRSPNLIFIIILLILYILSAFLSI